MKYVCLLRGINVGGNNKVSMSDLRQCFLDLGFENVSTYINSGNVFFDAKETNVPKLIAQCETAIKERFGFPVVVTIISKDEFVNALSKAPSWWGNGDRKVIRSEALFVIPPTTADEVLKELRRKSDAPDKFASSGHVVFWSLPTAEYNKSIVPKIIGTPVYRRFTMRGSNTTKKLLSLLEAV